MNTEVYIEGQRLDISDDISALFTYAIDDLRDFSARSTGFSKTIVFPGSGRNNELFGHAFEFTAYNIHDPTQANVGANFNAARGAACMVLVHNVQVFKGVLRLLEVRLRDGALEYEAAIFGELGGLISGIGAKLLAGNGNATEDLDFSAYNRNWSATNIINSWSTHNSTGGGSGVYFPLIDHGLVTTDHVHYKFHAMRPALYVREYIDKILTKAGYTFDCPFFDTAFFKRLIIPHNEDRVYMLTRIFVDHYSLGEPGLLFAAGGAPAPGVGVPVFGNSHYLVNFSNTAFSTTNQYFTHTGVTAAMVRAVALLSFTCTGGEGKVRIYCAIKVNSVVTAIKSFVLTGVTSDTYTSSLTITMEHYTMSPLDVFHVECWAVISTPTVIAWSVSVEPDTRFRIEPYTQASTNAVYNSVLDMNYCVPKGVLQKDFLLSIVKMFNLCIIEHPDIDRHVIITPFPDFFDNSDPLDWSSKVDRGREISLKPMSEVTAKYYNFQYEKDGDFYNDLYSKRYAASYGDRLHDTQLEFVAEQKDLKIIFASSPLVGYASLDKRVTSILKIDSSGVEDRFASKIRILQAKRIAVGSWNILNDAGGTITSTSFYGYAGHVDDPDTPQGADLNFGTPAELFWQPTNAYTAPNLFNAFYSAYMAEITDKDSKLLTCHVRLSPVDIYQLDFSNSILIDGQIWRLNRVVDYDAVEDGVTKCQLLKVINISY